MASGVRSDMLPDFMKDTGPLGPAIFFSVTKWMLKKIRLCEIKFGLPHIHASHTAENFLQSNSVLAQHIF
jgi:hypothetical protein